jgi:Flp pilus assembly protein CpaB
VANPSTGPFELSSLPSGGRAGSRVGSSSRSSSRRVLFGLLLALAAAVFVGLKYQQAQKTQLVVGLRRSVQVGQVVTASDLTETRLPDNTTIPSVPASRLNEMVGEVAQAPLYPGDVLDPQSVGTTPALPAGAVAMTLALAPEQAVGGSLRAGDVVAVFAATPGSGGLPPVGSEVLAGVAVRSVTTEGATGGQVTELVTLQLTPAQATSLDAAYRAYKVDLALAGR